MELWTKINMSSVPRGLRGLRYWQSLTLFNPGRFQMTVEWSNRDWKYLNASLLRALLCDANKMMAMKNVHLMSWKRRWARIRLIYVASKAEAKAIHQGLTGLILFVKLTNDWVLRNLTGENIDVGLNLVCSTMD